MRRIRLEQRRRTDGVGRSQIRVRIGDFALDQCPTFVPTASVHADKMSKGRALFSAGAQVIFVHVAEERRSAARVDPEATVANGRYQARHLAGAHGSWVRTARLEN